jgi:predicted transcriptional regulator
MCSISELACIIIAEKESLKNFDEDHAKVFSALSKKSGLNIFEIQELTGAEFEKILYVLKEFQKLSIISRNNDIYSIPDPLNAANLLISLAEANKKERISAMEHCIAALR